MIGLLLDVAGRIGAGPDESEDGRVRRLIWCTTLLCAAPLSLAMALTLAVFDLRLAAAVWTGGGAFWLAELLLFGVLRRGLESFALASQLASLVLAFVGWIGLGGPLHSGGLILMGLIGPFYALVFPRPRRAAWLLAAYVASVAASMALSGLVPGAQALPPVVNLVMFGATLTVVAVFVFVTLRFFVRERDRALGLLRRRRNESPGCSDCHRAPPRPCPSGRERSPGKSAPPSAPTRSDLGDGGGRLIPVSDEHLAAPSVEELEASMSAASSRFFERAGDVAVPLAGMSGDLCGALVVHGAGRVRGDIERRLLAGLAHQLGAALDMSRMRRQLVAAEERRATTRREMQERGVATLQVCQSCGRCYDHVAARCAADGRGSNRPGRCRTACSTVTASCG